MNLRNNRQTVISKKDEPSTRFELVTFGLQDRRNNQDYATKATLSGGKN